MNQEIKNLEALIKQYAADSSLEVISDDEIEKLRLEFPDLPVDYIEYLSSIGYGSVGKMAFTIYGGPMNADEIFDSKTAEKISHILILGDDYSGWMYGYDTSKTPWEMRLLDHAELLPSDKDEPKNFSGFILNEFRRTYELN